MKKSAHIFILSAPSGSGKTTVCKKVLKRVKNLAHSVSVTTRPPRKGEEARRDYFYLPEKSFRKKIGKGEFLEWEENFGHLYGTPKGFVLDALKKGKDALLTIDVKGAMAVKRKYPKSVLIFLKPPSMNELSRRLKGRDTDEENEIAERIKTAKRELAFMSRYDYIVINDRVEEAVEEIISIIERERR